MFVVIKVISCTLLDRVLYVIVNLPISLFGGPISSRVHCEHNTGARDVGRLLPP
jgi:hypothetical protein